MTDEARIAELNRWAESLDDPELDYLLAEAQQEFARVEQQSSAFDTRLIAVVGWALIGIGTLIIAGIREFDHSSGGIAAVLVVVGTSMVVVAGSYALLPHRRGAGLDLAWFSGWQPTTAHQMKAYVLAAVLFGTMLSRDSRRRRVWAMQLAVLGLLMEFGALVAYLIVTAGDG